MKNWFVNNYKLIKLNGILLLTFLFFLVLQLFSSASAVTQAELDANNETVAQWSSRVLDHYNLLDTGAFYIVYTYLDNNVTNYSIYAIPALTDDYTLFFTKSSSYILCNLHPYISSSADITSSGLIFANGNKYNVCKLDYDYATNNYTNNTNYTDGSYSAMGYAAISIYPTSSTSPYTLVSGGFLAPLNVSLDKVNSKIVYTNAKNYASGTNRPTRLYDFNKELVVFNYEDFIEFGSDGSFGDYIKFKPGLEGTDCSNILLESNSLNGTTTSNLQTFTVNTNSNYAETKFYLYNCPFINVKFRNSSNNLLYLYTKDFVNDSGSSTVNSPFVTATWDNTGVALSEFNGLRFYDKVDLYYKFNNVNDYPTYVEKVGDICYIPEISYDFVFSNGEKFSTKWFPMSYDFTYKQELKGFTSFLREGYLSDELFHEFSQFINPLYIAESVARDIVELLNSGERYNIVVNFRVMKCIAGSPTADGHLSVNDVEVVYSTYLQQNFLSSKDNETNVVLIVKDNDGNNIGSVTLNGNGIITDNTLNNGYTVSGDGKSVLDSNGNIVTRFESTDNGWEQLDSEDNVINTYVPISREDRIEQANKIGQDNYFTSGVNNIFKTLSDTLTGLLASVSGIGLLFSQAFNWLPSPIPELISFAFVAAVVFAVVRFVRGH